MNIFLTGAAGFIGFHTARALLARGDRVTGYDNFNTYYDPKLKEARAAILGKERNFTLIRGDILDRPALEKSMRGTDRVCHLAAMAGVRHSFERPEEYIAVNGQGFFNVLDEARLQKIPGLIYASTSSVYGGNTKMPFREDDPVNDQQSLYASTKRDNELLAHTYHHLYAIPVTGLRFFTVYGPYGRPDMALFLFTDAIMNGKPVPIFNHGKMQRDFTFIEDIVSGIVAAIDKNYPEEIFNLACGKKEELMDYINIIEQSCGKEAKREYLPMQPGDVLCTDADISKAERMLGYGPKTEISEGVPKFVEWYREYYNV
ncbi:MAG: NAD-dependent epimerase/dehydratase family protein [Candidatus Peregrinibacteria bacterium]